MKNIGMIVAVEMCAVFERYGEAKEIKRSGGFTLYTYELDGYTLYLAHCGVGEIAAAAAAQELISKYGVELIVNFGVVGGLTEDMASTRTCIVEKIVHYDMDLRECDPVLLGQYPGFDSPFLPATAELVEKAVAIEPSLKRVICASADKFVGDPEKKRALNREFGAEICEMESAGIVLTCLRNEVPCIFIKTVADSIGGGAGEFYEALKSTSAICLEITEKIIKEI